jgi:hypothetical protein
MVMQRELKLAADMQNMLVPSDLPNNERIEVSAFYKPHTNIGGDYYDFIQINENEIAFCISDISGKGIPAAILMANFQANMRILLTRRYSLPQFIEVLNTKVLEITKGEKFITLFIATYSYVTKKMTYVNAGHNPSILYNNGEIHLLDKGCTILGMFDTLPYVNLNGSSFNGFEVITQPSQGTLSILNYGIRYIPTLNYTGTDLFSIRVKGPNAVVSNTINVSVLVSAPSFNVGTANEVIVFNSTEVGANRDLTVPITNTSTGTSLEIASISIDQDADEFKLVLGSGQNESVVSIINNITITPGNTYSVKLRVQPAGIGVRSAKLKIDHN